MRNQPTFLLGTIQLARDDDTIQARGRTIGESSRVLDENGVQIVVIHLTLSRDADYGWHVAVVFRVDLLHSVSIWTHLRCERVTTYCCCCLSHWYWLRDGRLRHYNFENVSVLLCF
jgi:hypothetical protein